MEEEKREGGALCVEENWGRQTCGAQPARRRPTVGGIYRTKAIVVVIAVLVLVILAMGFMYSARYGAEKTYQSNTVQFGLRSIGELATQAGYFTSVQSISGSREVFGVTVPFTQRPAYTLNSWKSWWTSRKRSSPSRCPTRRSWT